MAEIEINLEEEQEKAGEKSRVELTQPGGRDTGGQDYANTMEALRAGEFSLPEFSSSYDQQISQLYDKIVGREPFSYDPMSDSLYGQYREQYAQLGRMAMMDSMGRAAYLTGGYGSSYSQKVGQQEYDQYLQKLGEVMPELYSAAYQRYKDRGADMESEYRRLTELRDGEYGRYRDQVEDIKYQQGMEADREKADNDRRDKLYDRLVELITRTGYSPSQEELEQSGMSQSQADAYKTRYSSGGGGGSYGGYYYGGKSWNSKDYGDKTQQKQYANKGVSAGKLYKQAVKGKK